MSSSSQNQKKNIVIDNNSHLQGQQQQQSNHSLRVKFEQIKANQFHYFNHQNDHRQKLIKKPYINLKLQQNYPDDQSSSSNNLQEDQQLSSMGNMPPSSNQLKRKSTTQINLQSQSKKSEISNFIIKTYRILEDKANSQIIHWTDEGNAFIVKNKDKFQNQILPKYFKHKKFSSFVRQLNMYDFHKIRKEKEIPIFKHKYFKQGCVDLLSKIKRKSGDEGIMGQGEDEENINLGEVGSGVIGAVESRNYIPSLFELTERPLVSAISFRSRSALPQQNMLTSQPSLGLLPLAGTNPMPSALLQQRSQLEILIQQNSQLNNSILQLSREQLKLELQLQKKRQKLNKILGVLVNCDLDIQGYDQNNPKQEQLQQESVKRTSYTLRDLQQHFSSEEEEGLGFSEYLEFIRGIYCGLKSSVSNISNIQQRKQSYQQHKSNY